MRAWSLGLLLALALNGCLPVDEPRPLPPEELLYQPGMKLIPSQGRSFTQGSKGGLASPEESPPVTNSFSYDFLLDSVEVTQSRFRELLGRDPVPEGSPYGKGDAYPVYNVSWFDAALFCNARSKEDGYDTIYEYSRADVDQGGGAYNLAGLSIHLDREGYRLPTEAEWEYSASAGTGSQFAWGPLQDTAEARKYAWYAGNSQNTSHEVATLAPNSFGLYDMAGNVMEWVNDWKGAYPASGISDFAGARDPGPDYELPVKGGAFNYGFRELRPANRSATYATIPSARAEYVGFRCARGTIAHPHFSSADGQWEETDPVTLEIARLQGYVAGRPARLVFVNAKQGKRHLVYVDFARTPPVVREFTDIENVFYPVISPDGNWVAFGTAPEGDEKGSSIYVRRLGALSEAGNRVADGFIPRWWVNSISNDTMITYVNSAIDNSDGRWPATLTLARKISGGAAVGGPVTLASGGGFHDGRSRDGRFLATGYRRLKLRDLQTGATRTLFAAPQNGKAEGDTSQVCNVSMAPDSTARTLFLDFGSIAPSRLTGSGYGVHGFAFMSDPDGNVMRWFRFPREEDAWEDLEWSNQTDFAVSGAKDASGARHHIYLVNLKDSIYTRLASGSTLLEPGLWLGEASVFSIPEGLNLDSLGHYNDPATDDYQAVFSDRLTRFWKRHKDLEVIFTGSSHVYSGIDARRITKLQAINIGYPAGGWLGQQTLATDYALNHCPKLKVMVMEVFPGWMDYPNGDFTWNQQMSKTRGVVYDQTHGYWKDGLPLHFEDLVQQAPNVVEWGVDSVGYRFFSSGGWGPVTIPTSKDWNTDNPEYLKNLQLIGNFARMLADKKIHLLLVNYPTNPGYKGGPYYGTYGPRMEVGVDVIKQFRNMETISPYVHFYDAYNFGDHDYGDAEAINSGHLSTTGATKLTARLDSLINTFR